MKPLLLLLLLSSVLLSSHLRPAAGRPLRFPAWLEEALLGAAPNGSALDEAEDAVQRFLLLQRSPYLLYLLPPAEDSGEGARRTAVHLLKRSEEPPLSIDLTFHLLRNMIQMAKLERQRARAQLNRKLLDEVGR